MYVKYIYSDVFERWKLYPLKGISLLVELNFISSSFALLHGFVLDRLSTFYRISTKFAN